MKTLYELLKESADLYRNFLELEYKKYDVAIKDDVAALDDIVSEEQVFYLKMRGFEQKREKIIEEMDMKGKSLKEIIGLANEEQRLMLIEAYDELYKLILETKKISNLCKTVIEVRLRRVHNAMNQMGGKNNTYSAEESRNNNSKSLIFSKKI
ncbi:MAG: flagellar protein FlgN [Sedimentibacter sp.]|uniref:flagellar protein FlgN n=1 Tax=Sedimentibacter sp. TaxID=1960295 RepID=UPI0029811400|nr:flagellar protein FlgN [Sedimentibacter sp.]MDW5300103.1 flagellar protein FlgN [Sedimentibacter sp.]